jgi:hypothetical protein
LGAGENEALNARRIAPLNEELRPAPVPGVSVLDVEATGATIEWPAALGGDGRFRVEVRRFFLNADRALEMQWEEFRSATIARHGEVFRARLRGLMPQQPYWIRVLPQKDATLGEPLFVVRFDTPARPRHFTPARVALGVLFLTLAAVLWLRWGQRAA